MMKCMPVVINSLNSQLYVQKNFDLHFKSVHHEKKIVY